MKARELRRVAAPGLSPWAPALSKRRAGGGVCKAGVHWLPPGLSSPTTPLEPSALTS